MRCLGKKVFLQSLESIPIGNGKFVTVTILIREILGCDSGNEDETKFMNPVKRKLTRSIATTAGAEIAETKGGENIAVVRSFALTELDMTEAGLEERANETGSLLAKILHDNPPVERWGWGLNEW